MDGYSIVIRSPDLDDNKKETIKRFLVSAAGTSTTGCSLPKTVPGSMKKNTMFGNNCMHLPDDLRGEEMLVLDTPIKIGMHSSCRTKMVDYVNSAGSNFFLKAASPKTGLCFDPSASANTPTYGPFVNAIVDCCEITPQNTTSGKSNYIIHVGEMGQKVSAEKLSDVNHLFNFKEMRDLGIEVEIVQVDFGFVFRTLPDQLILASRKNRKRNFKSVLTGSNSKTHPLHKLPMPTKKKKMNQDELRGTLDVKKDSTEWEITRKNPHFIRLDDDNDNDDRHHQVLETYRVSGEEDNGLEQISVHPMSIFGIKAYSIIAHIYLQIRRRFPITNNEIFRLPMKNFLYLQTLLSNCKDALIWAFSIVKSNGIGFRVEVSVRPHFNDPLRTRGHLNDILLHACVAVKDFCVECKPSLDLVHTRQVQTDSMRLISELTSMMRHRHERSFSSVYDNNPNGIGKYSDWLRCKVSMLLITMGICPHCDIKYINKWLVAPQKWSPQERTEENGTAGEITITENVISQGTIKSLKKLLLRKQFPETAVNLLMKYAKDIKWDPKTCFISLGMRGKKRLSEELSNILSLISHKRSWRSRHLHQSNKNDKSPKSNRGWSEELPLTHDLATSFEDLLARSFIPQHPVDQLFTKFQELGHLWDPKRIGHTQILFRFIIRCHHSAILTQHSPETIKGNVGSLLRQGAVEATPITNTGLKRVCSVLTASSTGKKQNSDHYIRLLCKKYKFPPFCSVENLEAARERNRLINEVLDEDIVVCLPSDNIATTVTFHRIFENRRVSILLENQVYSTRTNSFSREAIFCNRDIFCVIAKYLNTSPHTLRKMLDSRLSLSEDLDKYFLDKSGFINPLFKGKKTLRQLEACHAFTLVSSQDSLTEFLKFYQSVPEVIIPMVCLVYREHAAFYDVKKETTHFMIHQDSCIVVYSVQACNCKPLFTPSLVVTRDMQGFFELNKCTPSPDTAQYDLNIHTSAIFTLDPIGGRSDKVNRLSDIPGCSIKTRRRQPFYTAAGQLLKSLDENYLEDKNGDFIGIIPFLEELSCDPTKRRFQGFGECILANCPELRMPLRTLAVFIQGKGVNELNHKLLCPIICLKLHNLILGVIDRNGQDQIHTYFYAFDTNRGQVSCKCESGILVLKDRPETLYFYSNKNQNISHFMPSDISGLMDGNNWHYYCSIVGKYSRLGQLSLMKCCHTLKKMCHIDLILDQDIIDSHLLRPEHSNTTVIPVQIVGRSRAICYLSQMDIEHHALIAIFPGSDESAEWDACIVHHPLQDPSNAEQVLRQKLSHATGDLGTYNYFSAPGILPENCESGFLILMYAYLGSHSDNLEKFRRVINKAQSEDDLQGKIRSWMKLLLRTSHHNRTPYPDAHPAWLQQLLVS